MTNALALAAFAIVALSPVLPVGEAPSSSDSEWVVVFEGEKQWTSISPDGERDSETTPQTVLLFCTLEACSYNEYYTDTLIALSAGQPTGSASWDQVGDFCADSSTWKGAGTTSVDFAGDSLTVETMVDGGECEGSSIWAQETAFAGDWVSGELCVLTGEPCPAAASEAVVSDADGSSSAPPPNRESASRLSTGSPAAPSTLSALATPEEAGTAPQQLALGALLTVVLVLLVAFPTSLLNSAVETGADRVSKWRSERRRPHPVGAADVAEVRPAPAGAATTGRWWWAASGVVVAGVLSAFVDPQFGFNPGSARVLLSILVSFAIDVVLGWLFVIWIVRRLAPQVKHSFVFKPVTLLVVVAAVVFTRLTGFEPGIVFGLVAGVAFGTLAGRGQQAKAVLVTLGYAFGVALLAWVVYGVLGGGAAAGESFWQTFLLETLAAVAVGGMAALPVALFPLRGMAGHAIWAWNRWVWAACYAVGLFAFFIVLMPMPFSWAGVSLDLWAWIGIYLLYAIGAVVAWLLISRPWQRDHGAEPDSAAAPATDVEPAGSRDGV